MIEHKDLQKEIKGILDRTESGKVDLEELTGMVELLSGAVLWLSRELEIHTKESLKPEPPQQDSDEP